MRPSFQSWARLSKGLHGLKESFSPYCQEAPGFYRQRECATNIRQSAQWLETGINGVGQASCDAIKAEWIEGLDKARQPRPCFSRK
jgi:hypothetical protein